MMIAGIESHPSVQWGKVAFLYHEKTVKFPIHIPSGEIFNLDPDPLIRAKCLSLVILTPLVSLARCVYWIAKAALLLLTEAYRFLDGQKLSQDTRDSIAECGCDSVRALGYGILLTGYAVMGIGAPYCGRRSYGHFERMLNRHSDGPHRDKFYLAFCFQRLCVLPKEFPNNSERVTDRLNRFLTRIDAIRAAFWSCSCDKLRQEVGMLRAVH